MQAIAHRVTTVQSGSDSALDSISLLTDLLRKALDPQHLDQLSGDELQHDGGVPWSQETGRRRSITKLGLVADRFPLL